MFDWQIESRERLGKAIAAVAKVRQKGAIWIVPSQSGQGRYTVCPDAKNPHCTCADHEETGERCKHLYAVQYVMERELHPDGTETVTETVTATRIRQTYPQNWPAYNSAQTNEKDYFQALLFDLCQLVTNVPQRKGRPRMPLRDALFGMNLKVFSTLSARRFMSDLRTAHARGFISAVPHFNSILNYMEEPGLAPILTDLITVTSLPFRELEEDFACDSTGFGTSRFIRWQDRGSDGDIVKRDWVKAHIVCGVCTNVVTAVKILDRRSADGPQLPELLRATAENFRVAEVSADKAYSTRANLEAIEALGVRGFIPFKSNTTGTIGGLWARAFHYFCLNRDEFLQHYHKRSNVEATFSMIKRKFGDNLRSRSSAGMRNEALCKILCHNICCLIQSVYEFGINPSFRPS